MSNDKLIEAFGSDSQVKRLYDSIESLKDASVNMLMQQSMLNMQELNYVDILYGLGEDFDLKSIRNEAIRIMLLSKSLDGWFLERLTDVLKELGRKKDDDEGTLNKVEKTIKEAFSG